MATAKIKLEEMEELRANMLLLEKVRHENMRAFYFYTPNMQVNY